MADTPESETTARISPERWGRVASVFDDAFALGAQERGAFLDAACTGDAPLRSEVERMLRAADAPDSFLDASAFEKLDALIPDVADAPVPDSDESGMIGTQVGAFRLVRELGRGGMGVVYLAERSDEQFTQRVALKLVKRGMDTDFVLRRFRAERQILASLSHPNIARLLDGGTTTDGRPYFVMEYIEGERIDRYATTHGLSLADRLQLFLKICDAVAYAHQQLVVHRDIKPANIMVSKEGVPTLLDFGIASLPDDDGVGVTSTAARALTPEYASPEQAAGTRTGTATDVWSLGVVLYELLTGSLPYAFTSRTPEDVAAHLRDTEPVAPSDAAVRGNVPWGRRLRGDLDTIVLLALRREPERRYASVEAFATDLRRYIGGIPVQARATSVGYRAGKFVQHNKALVVAGAALVVTMIAGSAATAWQARIATQQATRAERRFSDLRTLAHSVLFDYHDAVANLPGSTPVRERLVKDGLAYLDELSADSVDDRSLQFELAQAYRRMADVQGGAMRNNLGNSVGAIASYRKAIAILEPMFRADSTRESIRTMLSDALAELGVLLWETGDLPAARTAMVRANALVGAPSAEAARDTGTADLLNHRHDYLGQVLYAMGNSAEARREYTAALAALDAIPEANRGGISVRRSYSVTLQHLAELIADAGEHELALQTNRRALELRKGIAAAEPLNAELQRALAVSYYYDGENLARLERYTEALASYRRDLEITQGLQRVDPGNALYRGDAEYALVRLGDMATKAGNVDQAIRYYTESYDMHVQDLAKDSTNLWKRASTIEAQAKLAESHARLRHTSEALAQLSRTEVAMARTTVDSTDATIRAFFAETYAGLAQAYVDLRGRGAADAFSDGVCRNAGRMFDQAESALTDMIARKLASQTDSTRLTTTRAARVAARKGCPAL